MNPLALLPYALGAYGGVQGYRSARDRGQSGLSALLSGAAGAFGGYNLGQLGGFAGRAGFGSTIPTFANLSGVSALPMMSRFTSPTISSRTMSGVPGGGDPNMFVPTDQKKTGSIFDILKSEKDGEMAYSPGKVSAALAAATYLGGAFDQGPVDMYMPGYNMGVLDIQANRPGYTYIDPTTGQEKEYEKMYVPEEAGKGQKRINNLSIDKIRLRSGGLAEIKKFNEGGINYLPSKMTHDENDSNNYVRASGYVEDGAGVGDSSISRRRVCNKSRRCIRRRNHCRC